MSPDAAVSGLEQLSHYPAGVPRSLEFPNCSLPELIEQGVRQWPERTALVYYGSRWTYRRFWEQSARFASALARDGFAPGDRLALYLPNCPAYPIAYFGALRAGVAVVQVSPLYLGQDLLGLLDYARPRGVVTLTILYPQLAKIENSWTAPVVYVATLREFYPWPKRWFVNRVLRKKGMETRVPQASNVRSWSDAVRSPEEFAKPHIDIDRDIAVLQYTGGTTGTPKAAMLSHRNLVANALQCRAWFNVENGKPSVVLAALPLFHVYGMTVALNYPLAAGATIVLQTRPDPPEILRLIDRWHPTQLPGVPAIYAQLLHQPGLRPDTLRSIRVCVSGAAPLPREVARRFEELSGGNLVEGYGLSEASPVTHANPIQGERRPGSIGLPLPNTEQRVVDPEGAERELALGEVGELEVRGPQVMLGYFERPEESRQVLHDGWLRTGDLARIDADGYAYIVDRKKDVIDVGGFKVVPREVEEVLYQHPGVAEAAVIGIPDPELGEVVEAHVVARPGTSPTAEELVEFVRERLAHYKAPRSVRFRESLPKSAAQKVIRRLLREPAAAQPQVSAATARG